MNPVQAVPPHTRLRAGMNAALATVMSLSLVIPAATTRAADSWLSRAIEVTPNGRAKVHLPTHWQKDTGETVQYRGGTSSRTVFDVTISLHNDPAGDDDPSTDNGEAQSTHEAIVRYFADAVCEQTNGNHRLGKVRLFTSHNQQAAADIIWNERMAPQANLSGFGASGLHIYFGDVFPNGAGGTTDYNMLDNPKAAGYTLGHEWGHYTYGLFDEYVGSDPTETDPRAPQPTDIVTAPSIMNYQWEAVDGSLAWLNHSTSDNIGATARTAQGRVYGKSGWDILIQDPADDPKSGNRRAQPDRTQYITLAHAAPTAADNWVRVELPDEESTCRDDLEILWVDGDFDLQIVLDRSGSMGGSPISNARQAASLLVDTTADGQTGLGIGSFAGSYVQNAPMQAIPDPGDAVKAQIKTIIGGINAGGSTRLYDGALNALSQLGVYQASNSTSAPQVVFLLSDGDDTSSSGSESDVVSAYQAANTPLFTFGFGGASPTGTLLSMANATGGQYTFSPTDLGQITQAFLQANAVASDLKNIVDADESIAPGAQSSVSVPVDTGLESLNIVLNFAGAVSDLVFTVNDAAGDAVTEAMFDCVQVNSTQAACSAEVDSVALAARGGGDWGIDIANVAALDRDVNLYVSGLPGVDGSFSARVAGAQGNQITYPAPIVLTTAVIKEYPITGVRVDATITDPLGQTQAVAMSDDGTGGDAEASDGIYSAILGYDANGTYAVEVRIDNAAGTARYTVDGLQPAHFAGPIGGEITTPQALPSITENFARVTRTNIVVTGRPFGDANASFFTAAEVLANNAGVGAVIDVPADEDYFVVRDIDLSAPLLVRVSDLSLGMDPQITIYASDSTTQLAEASLATDASTTGYVFVELPVDVLTEPMYVLVRHADPNASRGGYDLSAGASIPTDRPPNALPSAVTDVVSVVEGVSVQADVIANDADADGDVLTVDSVDASGSAAVVALNPDGQLTYNTQGRPFDLAPGDELLEVLSYTLTDGQAFREGAIRITVKGNTPPRAVADAVTTGADRAVTIDVLANDTDADRQAVTLTAIDTGQTQGTAVDNGNGTVTFDPGASFSALTRDESETTTFAYVITDAGGLTDTGQVTVTVTGIAEPPAGGGGGAALNGIALLVLLMFRRRAPGLGRVR